jgi:tape measure domain-containing protein
MAKQVSEILVKLGIQGAEGLDKLKSSFRELEKAIGPTDETIEKTRRSIIEFGEASNKSEQLIKGQIAAFKGLRSQATAGGKVYNDLKNDIKELEGVIYGANAALEEQRKTLTQFGASSDATAFQIQQTINALVRLRSETRVDSEAFNKFGESISTLTSKLKAVNQETQNFADAQRRIVRPIGASSAAARQQIRDLELVTEALRDQRDELGALEGEARIRRGVADLAERGAPSAGRLSFEEALAESLLGGQALRKLLPVKDIESALDEVRKQIGDFQREIEVNLSKGIQRSFQETARAGRESARAMAAAFSDPELINVFNRFDDRLGEIPQTATGFSQRLRELQQVFANTARSAENYISVALDIARVQREASAATQGLGAALVRDLNTGVAVRNKKNLQEAIGQLQAEMNELDMQTAEGSRLYAENANQVRNLERQLRELGDGYRHVADMATQAATAQASEATARVTANYLNRGMVRAQEQALAELGQRVRAGVAATPLALPAAGQTSAPGTGLEISGGARVGRATGRIQQAVMRPFPGEPGGVSYGPQATEEQLDRARRAAISEAAATREVAEAKVAAEQQVRSYRAEIDKARRADIGSIESTQRLRDAINQYRSTLPGASAEFRKLTKDLGDLDVRSEKLSRNLDRRRMGGMQMAQAAGAAISGGIFGGPEGFLGGAIGGITGGVGGAFVGAAAGAQVGMLRQQLGGFADYAAQIQKMEIALRNAAGSQGQFNQAIAAAASATQNLNVPQDVAIQGMTRLTAAVKGAGGQVSDAELVFRNVTSAIKATGGSAQDVDGAITAMVQVFSKGKVSAEELSGQLGERLPGAVTKFAKANDMTLPELQKGLEQGQVGLNELMNFIIQLGNEYTGVAGQIAGSSQDAGARLTVAFNEMRIAVGEALQPIGAEFQEAFIPFIENITPALTAALPAIGTFALNLAKNLDVLAASLAALAAGSIVNAIAQAGGLVVIFNKLTAAVMATNAALLLNPWVALAAGITAATVAIIKHNQAQEEYRNLIDNGAGATDELKNKQIDLEARITAARKSLEGSGSQMGATGRQAAQLRMKIANLENQLARINKTFTVRLRLEREGFTFNEAGKAETYTVAGVVYSVKTGRPIRRADGSPLNGATQFAALAGGDKSDRGKSEADKAAREAQRRFDEELQNITRLEDRSLKRVLLEGQIFVEKQKQQAIESGSLDSQKQLADITAANLDLDVKATALAEENKKLDDLRKRGLVEGLDVKKVAEKMQDNILEDLQIQVQREQLVTRETQVQYDIKKQIKDLDRSLNQELQDRQYQLGLINQEEYNRLRIERERIRLEEAYRGLPGASARIETGVDLFRREIDPTFAESLQSQLAIVRRELDDLTKPINQVVGAANAIGEAFSQSFASVINGSATTQEALASFFQNLANYFLDMAAQIIQKMIVMAILNQIVGLLPGGSKATGPVSGLQSGGDFNIPGQITTGIVAAANGAAFSRDGIQPFAMGGIVNKPTLFKYADGGTGRFGLMGEAGPEAIIPLKRGRDGRLGVAGGGGTSVVVNVDAKGTQVEGNQNQGRQLGAAISAAVQQELIKQRRPGGLLAG